MAEDQAPPGLLGISFDAVPLSGVVVEFLKVAWIFRNNGYRIHLDLGYEIKSDKGPFFAPHEESLPGWVNRIRTLPEPFDGYSNERVAGSLKYLAQPQEPEPDPEEAMARCSREIAGKLV